ncbi:DUF998 domain-containing protein [Conyzicola nivalis]|uniref:ABC transporter permease n=1 Tax=Conyzicola nivalis TaxID=1477021 RepID=A0A916SB75_9MICO|nr:DUF998 domain-containing protein [Conyzicola nivalis]GGA91991.1 ABC transporter permease [Conyzicola nivalis]
MLINEPQLSTKRPIPMRRLLRHPVANSESLESAALMVGAAVFVVVAAVSVFVFWGYDVPIAGPGSIGQYVAFTAALATIVVFVAARILVSGGSTPGARSNDRLRAPGVRLRWYDIAATALAHGGIALLGWLGLASLLERSFQGAVVFPISAAVLAAAAVAVTAYAVFLSAVHLTPMLLSLVLVVFLVVGCFASMLSATDPLWWQKNLSTLGIPDDVSALAFNITLIVAGVIVTVIAHFATASLPVTNPKEERGRGIVRGGLVLMGVLLACVGLFPLDRSITLHNISATGMAITFVVLGVGLGRFVPSMPRIFVLLGYVFVAAIVVLAILFATGYFNLTAVELIAFLLIFSWLIVFLRNAGEPVGDQG